MKANDTADAMHVSLMHEALKTAGLSYSATSWSGFNIFGDRKSIDEVRRLDDEVYRQTTIAKELRRRLEIVQDALEQSVNLQSHYAELLNIYDNGKRLTFASAADWIARLEALNTEDKG